MTTIPSFGNTKAIVLTGGPIHKIQVNLKVLEFEMHPYCGPNLVNKRGDPLKHQPDYFLEAASKWAQQGQKIDKDGFCEWNPEIPLR